MATPSWVQDGERWDGANDPTGNSDVVNRPNREIWAMFCVEHDPDGDHFDFNSPAVFESDEYTGNGSDDRDIPLTNPDMDIKYLSIWCSTLTGLDIVEVAFYCDAMTGDDTKIADDVIFVSDWIQLLRTGTFQVGQNPGVNDNGETYHYLAIGVV